MRAPIQAVMQAAMATLLVSLALSGCGRKPAEPAADSAAVQRRRRRGQGPQRLQLVRLHRPGRDRGFPEGNRHQGELRRLRLERGARDQAAHGQFRLRRRGAERLLPRAPDPGRRVPQARHGRCCRTSPTSIRGCRRRIAAHDPGNEHAVIYMWGTTGIGYRRDKVARDHARCADRLLGPRVRPGRGLEVQGLRRLVPRRTRPTWWVRCCSGSARTPTASPRTT